MRKQSEIESQRLVEEEKEKEKAYHEKQAKKKEEQEKVERTKNRPIASEKISVNLALIYTFILCGLAFLILINFLCCGFKKLLSIITVIYFFIIKGKRYSISFSHMGTHTMSNRRIKY